MVNVVGTPGSTSAVAGVTASGVPALGEGAGAPATPPPQELSRTTQQADKKNAALRSNIRFIFTKTPLPVLRHHNINISKALGGVGFLPTRMHIPIIPARSMTRHFPTDFPAGDKFVAVRKKRRYDDSFQKLSFFISVLGSFIERPVRRETEGPQTLHFR